MEVDRRTKDAPFFSVCVPQHNRTAFLIEACKSLAAQTFQDFELCISDDRSTDGREAELIEYLESSGMSFIYRKQEKNSRYDGNLRASIALSRGRYCFLLGNDDAFATPETLQELYDQMRQHENIGVVITNFEDYTTGKEIRRIQHSGLLGAGPAAAANHYRDVSFVSGVVLAGPRSRALFTDKWDGSEMYQMYLTARLLAEGLALLGLEQITIRKDIQVAHEAVDTYALKPRLSPCPIIERFLTMHYLGRLVMDAINPFLRPEARQPTAEKVLQQILVFTFPFWIFEYRRVQSWRYAAGLCLGMRLRHSAKGIELSRWRKFRLAALHALVSLAGLSVPLFVFDSVVPQLHAFAKSGWGRRLVGVRNG